MTHEPDEPHVLPDLTDEVLDKALALLGYPMNHVHQCGACVPEDPAERIAAKLGGLNAVVQAHITHHSRHVEAIMGSYHLVRDHLGQGPCSCGRVHTEVIAMEGLG